MDIQTIVTIVTSVIAGASIMLQVIAPLTKTTKDDKVLLFLKKALEVLSLHVKEDSKVEVVVKDKK
jgi:hypothetical protein